MQSKVQKEFYQAIDNQIVSCDLPQDCCRWLLGVSGGCDSMGLMYGLVGLRELYPERFDYLHVAHLNHQLRRAESDADAAFVAEQANRLGLPVTMGSVDVAQVAQEKAESIETAARNQRYRFLTETARENGCQVVAVGHNADDDAETILHRIIRGTGIRGLRGIPSIRPMAHEEGESDLVLIRPLLSLRREEIEAFLTQMTIEWRQDTSNESTEYTRNRIRHELIPYLKNHFNPQVSDALLRLSRTAQASSRIFNQQPDKELTHFILERSKHRLILDAARLALESQDRQIDIIFQTLTAMEVSLGRIGYKQINEMFKLINHSTGGGSGCQYPDGLQVQRDNEKIIFQRPAPMAPVSTKSDFDAISIPTKGAIDLPNDIFQIDPKTMMAQPAQKISVEQVAPQEGYLPEFLENKTSFSEVVDLDRCQGELYLRVWRPGDRFTPLGMTGEKTLGDFFTDLKIPALWRSRVGLVCDDQGILWVLGLRIAERVKVREGTSRILKMELV